MSAPAIFVSHSHKDDAYCREFVARLRGAGLDVWYDEHNASAGHLMDVISLQIRQRPVFVLILTPAALASDWVKDECVWAYGRWQKDKVNRVFLPVLAETVDEDDIWDFVQVFRRIEQPGLRPWPVAEAARRVALAIAPNAPALHAQSHDAPPPASRPFEEIDSGVAIDPGVSSANVLTSRGNELLKELRVNEATAEFARAAQLDPAAVGAHLGLAEANLALGQYGVAGMACQATQRLAPNTADAYVAQAIEMTMAGRYDAVLAALDRAIELDPQRAYAHALRGYALRQLRQTYDASLAESKAARMSGTHDLPKLFPPVKPVVPEVLSAPTVAQATPAEAPQAGPPRAQESTAAERTAVRARFATRNMPIVTYVLMAINVAVYLIGLPFSSFDLFDTASLQLHPNNPIYNFGIEIGMNYLQQDPTQWYRIFTAMFLHASIIHLGFNMLSLYFVGVVTEQVCGHSRFLWIYLLSGIIAGMAQAVLAPASASLGAAGAIFGICGVFGIFLLLSWRKFNSVPKGSIWRVVWIALSIVLSFGGGVAIYANFGGLIAGLALGALLVPQSMRQQGAGDLSTKM